ncbi:hypothetical protein CLCR_07139 [Cladophialophora carrionii]|uniref:DUF6590 domain-containing protein n=1 Tax=Cladophialophora carrionii TaxID=86049 RepID=A0A1C1CM19_9EURO|nr:hypothetical protein CLCR_07139 [Cladophialophora carrionii]
MSQRDSGYGQYGRDMSDRATHGRSQGSGGKELTTATPSTLWRGRDEDREKERRHLQREPRGIQSSDTIETGKYRAGSDEMALHDDLDDERERLAARPRSGRAFSGTSAQRDHSPARAAFCLGDDLYHFIQNVARNDINGIGIVTGRQDLFGVDDYLFLLEAIQCDVPARARFRRACIRLYLLVRKYNSLPDQHECQHFLDTLELEDRRNHDEQRVQSLEALVQQMSSARGVRMPGGDSLSVSRLSAMTPAFVPPQERRRSAGAPSQNSEDTRQSSLHVDFGLRKSTWFTIGRVFMVLWHENDTGENTTSTTRQGGVSSQGLYGENVWTKVRRFAVVREGGHGFSWAIPIATYREQGLTRRGFNARDCDAHAIIHMEGTPAESLPNEPFMNKRPIAVTPASWDKKLHKASRIRFDKVFTIEHNVKVSEVGTVSGDSMTWFCRYWRMEASAAADAVTPRSGRHG